MLTENALFPAYFSFIYFQILDGLRKELFMPPNLKSGEQIGFCTLLLNVFSVLKETHFYILFVVTVAGVVLCGSPKSSPVHRS